MILCFGENTFGQLGIGSLQRDHSSDPFPFGISDDTTLEHSSVADVQCGSKFSIVLGKNGKFSICGTLNGIVAPVLTPVEVMYPLRCIQIACGRKHILALMDGGFVLSWGTGYFGQLGHGDDSSWDSPKMISALEPAKIGSRVVHVACGGSHSGALTDSGRIFMWGLNKQGQCGLGVRSESITEPRPLDLADIGNIRATQLVCGRNHSAIVSEEGRLYTWGSASFGRLGIPEAKKSRFSPSEVNFFRSVPVHSLVSGDFHMLALGHDCSVYAWGYGNDGQSGTGSLQHLKSPRRIDFFDGLQVASLVCGSSWSVAVTSAGVMYVWGYGDGGWLGLPQLSDLPIVDGDNYLEGDQSAIVEVEHRHTRCFDSRHNVLSPQRVKSLTSYVVEGVRCGGSQAVLFVSPRAEAKLDSSEGDGSRKKKFDSSSAKQGGGGGGAAGDGRDDESEKQVRKTTARGGGGGGGGADHKEGVAGGVSSGSTGKQTPRQQSEAKPISSTGLTPRSTPRSNNSGDTTTAGTGAGAGAKSSSSSSAAGETALELTAQLIGWTRHKKLTEIKSALANGADVNVQDVAGNTPLIVACQNGHSSLCQYFIEQEANPNIANKKGNTALHFCFAFGFEDVANFLISHGADEYATNAEGLTCYEGLTKSDLDKL